MVVSQSSGQAMSVPPGWGHAVVNAAACIKVAWDYVLQDRLHEYALIQQTLHPLFGKLNSPDYVSVQRFVMHSLNDFINAALKK